MSFRAKHNGGEIGGATKRAPLMLEGRAKLTERGEVITGLATTRRVLELSE
jgi:hypothetical protein